MAFSTNGFTPVSVEYLTKGQKYRVRINGAQVKQFVDQGQIIEKLEITLDVQGVKLPRPNSMNFKSRPLTNEKNAQDKWDERWTRFKEIFGIDLYDDNFSGWVGKIGELEVDEFKGTPFFCLPKKQAGSQQTSAPAQMAQPQPQAQAMQRQAFQPAPQQSQQFPTATQAVNNDGFVEDIPF